MAPHTGHRSVLELAKAQFLLCSPVRSAVLIASLCSPDDLPKKRPAQIYKPSNPDTLAYLDFSVSTTGMLAGVKVRVGLPRVQ